MRKIMLPYLLRLAVFWLAFFASFRLLFILYHHAKIPDGKHSETSLSIIYGIPMDLSVLAFLMFIPFCLWAFQQFYKNKFIHVLNKFLNFFLIIVAAAICLFNIKFYGEYETMLSTEELAYLLYPREAVTFISVWSLTIMAAGIALFSGLAIRYYRRFLINFSQPLEGKLVRTLFLVITPLVLFVLARGGIKEQPIEATSAHYSSIRVNNDIATNPLWYLGYSFCNGNSKP